MKIVKIGKIIFTGGLLWGTAELFYQLGKGRMLGVAYKEKLIDKEILDAVTDSRPWPAKFVRYVALHMNEETEKE